MAWANPALAGFKFFNFLIIFNILTDISKKIKRLVRLDDLLAKIYN